MKYISLLIVIFSLASCLEKKIRDLESPCVANEFNPAATTDEPCVRRPANPWMTRI